MDKPSIVIAFIPSNHAAADDDQRFHDRARVDVVRPGRIDRIHGAPETSEHVELDAADLAQLLRRAYACGVSDAGGDWPAALATMDAAAASYIAGLEAEVVTDVPVAGELCTHAPETSTVLSLSEVEDEIEVHLGI